MRQSLEHHNHIGKVVESVDGVHDCRVVRPYLHLANNNFAVFIVAFTTVELAREAVEAVARVVHVRPPHSQCQVRISKGAVDYTTLEARLVALGALAVAAKAGDRIKDRGVGHVLGISVNTPVPVRLGTGEAAFSAQQVLVQLHIPAVPREEVGHEVDFRIKGKMGIDQVVHTRRDGIDVGILRLGQLAQAHSGTDVLGPFGFSKLAPFLANGRVGAGTIGTGYSARGSIYREGEDGKDQARKHCCGK